MNYSKKEFYNNLLKKPVYFLKMPSVAIGSFDTLSYVQLAAYFFSRRFHKDQEKGEILDYIKKETDNCEKLEDKHAEFLIEIMRTIHSSSKDKNGDYTTYSPRIHSLSNLIIDLQIISRKLKDIKSKIIEILDGAMCYTEKELKNRIEDLSEVSDKIESLDECLGILTDYQRKFYSSFSSKNFNAMFGLSLDSPLSTSSSNELDTSESSGSPNSGGFCLSPISI